MTDGPSPKPEDLGRDLVGDLAGAAPTDDELWGWGEDDLYEYVRRARAAWPAAIRRALAAEAMLGHDRRED